MNDVSVLVKVGWGVSSISIEYRMTYEIGWEPSWDIGVNKYCCFNSSGKPCETKF